MATCLRRGNGICISGDNKKYDKFPQYGFIAVNVLVLIYVSFREDHRANSIVPRSHEQVNK